MIVGRPCKAGIIIALGYHTFRATGITVYLLNGGLLGMREGTMSNVRNWALGLVMAALILFGASL